MVYCGWFPLLTAHGISWIVFSTYCLGIVLVVSLLVMLIMALPHSPVLNTVECLCIFSYLLTYHVGAIVLVISISGDIHRSSLLTLPYLSKLPSVYRGQFPCLYAHGISQVVPSRSHCGVVFIASLSAMVIISLSRPPAECLFTTWACSPITCKSAHSIFPVYPTPLFYIVALLWLPPSLLLPSCSYHCSMQVLLSSNVVFMGRAR